MTGGGCRRRIEIYESSPPLFIKETSIFRPNPFSFPLEDSDHELWFNLKAFHLFHNSTDLCLFNSPPQCPFSPFDFFDNVADMIQIEKSIKRIQLRNQLGGIKSLCDRVSALETGQMAKMKKKKNVKPQDRKYSWTTEIKTDDRDGIDRKYKWKAEIKSGEEEEDDDVVVKNYKWIAEIRGKGKETASTRTYTYKASTLPSSAHQNVDNKKKKKNKDSSSSPSPSGKSTVQIEEHVDPRVLALKHAFAKRGTAAAKGKKKELSPQDAAMMIQIHFRDYLIRRSQALRALRELAVAKAKLKELRVLFNNFSYRHRIVRDGEERQKFSEKIIILLLTVDAIEGADLMVRVAKRSMVVELEAMLEVVDPHQPPGKLGSMKRRRFDLPEAELQKEIAEGVVEVVRMLNQENKNGGTFEVCL